MKGARRVLPGVIVVLLTASSLSACGTGAGTSVASVCSKAAQQSAAVRSKLHEAIAGAGPAGGGKVVFGEDPRQEASYRAILSETASKETAVVRTAVEGLRAVASSAAKQAALTNLETSERRLVALHKAIGSGSEGGASLTFLLAEASGGCRTVRPAISG